MLLCAHPWPATLDTSSADLIRDFFVPGLAHAVHYDRAVGFFSSAWLRIAAEGMIPFAAKGGRARWITSPVLDGSDWEALQQGVSARDDPVVRAALERTLDDLPALFGTETLSALAWLVADGILGFRLALPRGKLDRGDFHAKFGIFTDAEGDQVSFNGSYNDSVQGTRNYESIKVFTSWEPAYAPLVADDVLRFEQLWGNLDPNVRVVDLPAAARERIVRLRSAPRPYPAPAPPAAARPIGPHMPDALALRGYQEDAIQAWFEHQCRGLLEMATGTGKTITALAASVRLHRQQSRLAVVIAVPYQHLVDQWRDEARKFGYQPILAYRSRERWLDAFRHQAQEYTAGYRNTLAVIVTHTTFADAAFQGALARLSGSVLLIADEAHHLGAERSRSSYPANVPFRLALSATPDRWFDEEGTRELRRYFGPTVYAFPLERAIGVSLTPYHYHPVLVPLTDDELDEYQALSARCARLMDREDDAGRNSLRLLMIRRAELLNRAANKLAALSDLVDVQGAINHALFYCAPGQIDEVLRLLGWEKGLRVHRFTANESAPERQRLLADFAEGRLHGLVAMKCLDEGVDVPATRSAFLLASSSNPREFIQRRGRVLRRSPGKETATLFDLVAAPPESWEPRDSAAFRAERSIVRRELQRLKEFAGAAMNKHQALDVIWSIAARYGLMDF